MKNVRCHVVMRGGKKFPCEIRRTSFSQDGLSEFKVTWTSRVKATTRRFEAFHEGVMIARKYITKKVDPGDQFTFDFGTYYPMTELREYRGNGTREN